MWKRVGWRVTRPRLGGSVPAAYFDVDGTLVGTNLVHPTIMYLANQSSPMDSLRRMGRAAIWAPLMAAAELRDRRLFNEMLFSHYKGMSEDRMVLLSEEVFDSVIRPRIFLGTVDLIEKCKAAGYRIVLVTGSLDVTVAPLARYLGADDAITNRLEMKDGYATGKLLRPVVAGPTKARILADDARENGDDLAHCQAYSDSFSDVPMLSVVGHPQCINPDKKLRRLARAYQWPILDVDRPTPGQ
jgi:HAD superfamily hydrolase (TIGR01490 family)